MKTYLVIVAALLVSALAWGQEEPAREQPEAEEAPVLSVGAEADYNARYVWRGLPFSEGPVLNPSVWITVGNFTLLGWGNLALTDQDKPYEGQFNEADIYLTYAFEQDAFSLEATYQHYFYPNTDWEETGEVALTLAWSFEAFSVYTTHTLDVEEYDGAYFGEFGVSAEPELSDLASLEARAFVGYGNQDFNEAYTGIGSAAWEVAGVSLALTYYATDNLYLRPHLEYTSLLDKDLRETVEEPDFINVGIAAGIEF